MTTNESPSRETLEGRDNAAVRLGQRLRRARLARNLTQGEVAKNQFSVSYVSAVERGQIRPSLGALEKLAERLQVPVTDLLGDGEEPRVLAATSERRDTGADRQRDEWEWRLLEAQRIIGAGRPEALNDAIESLSRLTTRAAGAREQAQALLQLTRAFLQAGRADEARDAAQRGLGVAERTGDHDLTERLRFELGLAYAHLQSYPLAAETFSRGLQAADDGAVRDPLFRMNVLLQLGGSARQLGHQDEAVRYLEQAADASRDAVNPRTMAQAYAAMSQSYAAKGDVVSARYYAIRSVAAYDEARGRRQIAAVHAQYGRALAQAGDLSAALRELETARDIAVAQQDAAGIAEGQRALATLYLRENRLAEAEQAAQESSAQAEMTRDPVQRAETLVTLAQVQEHKGDVEGAERMFSEAIDLLQSANAPDLLSATYGEFSQFYERRGDDRRAFEMLKHAHSLTARAALPI